MHSEVARRAGVPSGDREELRPGGLSGHHPLSQAQMKGQSGRKDQPGIVDQAVVVEGDLDAVGVAAW